MNTNIRPVKCEFCDAWITFIKKGTASVPFDISWDNNKNYVKKKHLCKQRRKQEYEPNYVYPSDIYKTLVKDETGKWQHLGTVIKKMHMKLY